MINNVTIVIPTYNRPDRLKRAVDCITNQSFSDWELVIVNDGDDMGLKDYFSSLSDSRISYTMNMRTKGGNGARNTGGVLAKTDYIAFLDDDDLWHRDKLKVHLSSFVNSGGKGCSISSFCDVPEDVITNNTDSIDSVNYSSFNIPISPESIIKGVNRIGATSTILVEKSFFYAIGMFDESLLRNQDLEFIIRVASKTDIHVCYESMVYVCGHHEPSLEKVEEAKKNYWNIINPYLENFCKKDFDSFFSEEYRGLAIAAAKEGALKKTFYYLTKMLSHRIVIHPAKYYWVSYYLLKSFIKPIK